MVLYFISLLTDIQYMMDPILSPPGTYIRSFAVCSYSDPAAAAPYSLDHQTAVAAKGGAAGIASTVPGTVFDGIIGGFLGEIGSNLFQKIFGTEESPPSLEQV